MGTLLTTLSDDIVNHMLSSPDQEACGLIAKREDETRYFPCKNVHPLPERAFCIDPNQIWDIVDRGWDLDAIVHSHPHGHPEPSKTDYENFPVVYVSFGYLFVLGDNPKVVTYNQNGIIASYKHKEFECQT